MRIVNLIENTEGVRGWTAAHGLSFSQINQHASIYMQSLAAGDYYSDDGEREDRDRYRKKLKEYRTTFYTCHCTGVKAYESMRCIMGNQLRYVHSGEEIRLKYQKSVQEERRGQFMKWHKFFAWATVICFIITMMTGYEKK